jgi:hypothetical protein
MSKSSTASPGSSIGAERCLCGFFVAADGAREEMRCGETNQVKE